MKYSPEIVEKIYNLLASGDHTVENICKQVGISKDTFYDWKENKSDFSDAIKKADAERLQAFKPLARSGLAKLLDIYEYDEVTTEYLDGETPKIKSKKVVRKFIMPNIVAIMYALNNTDSGNFQHKDQEEKADKLVIHNHITNSPPNASN